MTIQAKLWGVRGSLPSPMTPKDIEVRLKTTLLRLGDKRSGLHHERIDDFLATLPIEEKGGFGGNTACCEIFDGKTSIIIDGGTGIRLKGYELLDGPCGKGEGDIHVFMTHFHWDHVMGLPFFVPLFIPGNRIHFYSVQDDAEETMRILFRKPNFPVSYKNLGAEFVYHQLEPRKPFTLGNITLTPYQLDHPDPCWGFRITDGKRHLAYCVDTECIRNSADALGPDLPLYQDAHVMIFDAQYTLKEAIERVNWGHAAATLGLDLAIQQGIEKVIFMHHDPAASDQKVADARDQTADYLKYLLKQIQKHKHITPKIKFVFAYDGMVIKI
jgi:phosphoribosyl 1,2-cyclic phosphodiesterase